LPEEEEEGGRRDRREEEDEDAAAWPGRLGLFHMPLWGTASGSPAADGEIARAPPGSSGGGGVKVIWSLLPTRRRLRLDPSAKLYFPCTHPELCSLLIHKFLFDCSAEASIPASVRCIKNRIFNSSKTGFLLTDFFVRLFI